MTRYDAVVAGGGSAGLAAAVAAARGGARTLVIERGGMLGGMGSQALVHTICGLYEIREEREPVFANDGFAPEFARRLMGRGGAAAPVRMGRLDVLPHDPVQFAALGDDFALETPGLDVWFHAELFAARCNGRRLEEAEIICRGHRERVAADAFIDATGDATLTSLAGAEFSQVESERLQRPAYVSILRGTEPGWLDGEEGRFQVARRIVTAVKSGSLPPAALGAGFRPGIAPDETFLTIDLSGNHRDGEPWDPASPRLLAAAEMEGRRTSMAIAAFLSNGCRVASLPGRAGVRESRRARGVHEMSEAELCGGADFPDGVVHTAWPMELRERPTGPRWRYPDGPRPASIPLRSLRHRDVENLWVAGRCLSASHEVQSSIRVIGTCLATGEVAGLAAVEAQRSPGCCFEKLAQYVIKTRQNLSRTC